MVTTDNAYVQEAKYTSNDCEHTTYISWWYCVRQHSRHWQQIQNKPTAHVTTRTYGLTKWLLSDFRKLLKWTYPHNATLTERSTRWLHHVWHF